LCCPLADKLLVKSGVCVHVCSHGAVWAARLLVLMAATVEGDA
jgi:hypothetical protein